MRFGTLDGRLVLVRDGRALDVSRASDGRLPSDAVAALESWDELRSWATTASWDDAVPFAPADLGAPVPTPRQVFAIALNYAPHAAEAGFAPPPEPLVFTKFPSCITGPVSTVELPKGNVDWEIEVVAVIGRGGYRIPRTTAWDAVAGLTLGQDLSERLLQLTGTPPQFSLAKSHPGFGPTGPVVVSVDELAAIGDRDDLAFESRIGEEIIQHGRTGQMIFPIDELVHRLSQVCRLLPGDLIFTGTPEGVGNRRTPPRFLSPGEELVSTMEHVGGISQRFVGA